MGATPVAPTAAVAAASSSTADEAASGAAATASGGRPGIPADAGLDAGRDRRDSYATASTASGGSVATGEALGGVGGAGDGSGAAGEAGSSSDGALPVAGIATIGDVELDHALRVESDLLERETSHLAALMLAKGAATVAATGTSSGGDGRQVRGVPTAVRA